MQYKLILLGLFALFGVFLLRGGITGNIISQSCCFGPECAPEYQCPTGAGIESPALLSAEDNNALSIVGLIMIFISGIMIFVYMRKRERNNNKRERNNNIGIYEVIKAELS